MFTYILSFDPINSKMSNGQVFSHIRSNRHVVSWYNAFPGTIIFKAELTISILSELLREFFENQPFILSCAAPQNMGGAQSQEIWEWINTGVIHALSPP
jgi:hypothetical protein